MTRRFKLVGLWAFCTLACSDGGGSSSEPDASGGRAAQGSSTGGSPVDAGGAAAGGAVAVDSNPTGANFDPAMTAGCQLWPANKLAPWVGFFFYGTDPGPCAETRTDGTSVTTSTFEYDAQNALTSVTYSEGTTEQYQYVDGKIATVTKNGVVVGTYTYTKTEFVYQYEGSYTAEWQLDTLGYPRKLVADYLSTAASPDVVFLYEYENCRLVRRRVESSSGGTAVDWQYAYDTDGRLVTITAADGETFQEDYSCWP